MKNSDYKYQPTTAFWKIQKLIRDGLPKFTNEDKKLFIIQGGQGAGKTIAILMLLIDYFNRNKAEITICSKELTKVKSTALKDFLKILKDYNLKGKNNFNKSTSTYYKDPSDIESHFIEFIGLDEEDVGKGRRRNIVYINEANKVTLSNFTDITARAGLTIIDYNPDAHFWANDLITDFNFLNLTYLDNEFLSENEVRNILDYKKKGFVNPNLEDYDVESNIKSAYQANKWRVYGLGKVGSVEGRIYLWSSCEYRFFKDLQVTSYFGVDWGAVDPFAIVECKYYDGTLYVHELNYDSENQIRQKLTSPELAQINKADEDGLVPFIFRKVDIPTNAYITCDSNRPNKIISARNAGYEYCYSVGGKSGLMDRIDMIQQIDVVFTNSSVNLDYEQMNYRYAVDKFGNQLERPEDKDNHLIDAIAYVVQGLFDRGIIKVL